MNEKETMGFLVRRKVNCPICKKVLKKGDKTKGAEYHKKCWERRQIKSEA